MLTTKLFQGLQYPLEIYNDQPIINVGIEFTYDSCGVETDFDFPDYLSSNLYIYNERKGRLIKTIPLTRSGNILIINSTDTVFEDNGNYFYEVVYLMSGGYEQVIRYGLCKVI